MYVGRQTKCITKLFNNSNVEVSLKTKNTIGKLLTQNKNIHPNKFNKCGVYQLTCHDCSRKNIAQTDRFLSCKNPRIFVRFQIWQW
jgi:hypothetical protein